VSFRGVASPRNQLLECEGRCQGPALFFCAGFLCRQSGPVREPKTQVPNTGTWGTRLLPADNPDEGCAAPWPKIQAHRRYAL
jgi:hypothetical protein